MNASNVYMILERSGENLELNKSNNEYVLEGVFAQFGIENNNNRIYEEKEYLPHIEYLKKKIFENRLLGELDHPEKFDISLSKVSHLIEDIKYDAKKRQVIGRVKLLDTPSGQIAKNLVDSGVPISISSRAAGVVKENKKVDIKKIFTYDLVADPGFENAKLSKVNESFGFSNDSEYVAIFEMNDSDFSKYENMNDIYINNNITEKNIKPMSDNTKYVSVEEMNKYSLLIKSEIEKINESIKTISSSNSSDKNSQLQEELGNIKVTLEKLTENQTKMIKFSDYLSENLNKSVSYSESIAEKLDKTISYSESIAEKVNQSIDFSDYLAEKVNQGIEYSEFISEKLDKGIQYSEYISENFDGMKAYAEHIASKLDESIQYGEYLAARINETVEYAEHVAEHVDNNIQYAEYISESVATKEDFNNLTKYAEYIMESISEGNSNNISEKSKTNIKDRYNDLDSKINSVLESVKKQKTESSITNDFSFTPFLSESKKGEFLSLSEADKKRVKNALELKNAYSEDAIVSIWEQTLAGVETNESWLTDMPLEYMKLWESASDTTKDKIVRQSKLYQLNTPYQIKNFWQTRGLGNPDTSAEAALNESARPTADSVNSLGYSTDYINTVKENLKRQFKR